MYTSMMIVAMTGSLVASTLGEGLAWQTDYAKAREMGAAANKPLAVFIGSGAGGQDKVSQDGKLSSEMLKSLSDNYVCLYVDIATPAGQKLATDFGNTVGKGLVISDRTGALQAFNHQGDLDAADMNRWLSYGASSSLAVTNTMSNNGTRISSYPPTSTGMMNYPGYINNGSYGFVSSGSYFGGGCPNGNCFRK